MQRVLIVEDEPDLAAALDGELRRHGVELPGGVALVVMLRPEAARGSSVVQAGDLEVDVERYEVRRHGEPLELTTKELGLLVALARRPGALVRREELAEEVWGTGLWPVNRSLDVHISSLRRKLGDSPRHPRYVQTVHGLGFRLLP